MLIVTILSTWKRFFYNAINQLWDYKMIIYPIIFKWIISIANGIVIFQLDFFNGIIRKETYKHLLIHFSPFYRCKRLTCVRKLIIWIFRGLYVFKLVFSSMYYGLFELFRYKNFTYYYKLQCHFYHINKWINTLLITRH